MTRLEAVSVLTAAGARHDGSNIGDVQLSVCETRGLLRMQCRSEVSALSAALQSTLGTKLPTQGQVLLADAIELHWLTPSEWLVVCDLPHEVEVQERLFRALSGQHVHVSPITDSRAIFALEGTGVTDIVAQGCAMDLDPAAFPAGQSVTTRFAKVPVLLHRRDEYLFELMVDRSLARYVWEWMRAAADCR